MYKKLAVFILLAALAVQTLNGAAIVFSYYTNTASYAANCENKAKPMLHCNGRCQMLKKIKQAENKDKQSAERKSDRKLPVMSSKSFFAKLTILAMPPLQQYNTEAPAATVDRALAIFHPPGA